jgi:DNA-binding transcriptional regulator YiaG
MLKQENLRDIRESMNMTQKDFAKMLDVPFTTYTKWERGDRKAKPYTLLYIEEVVSKNGQG